MNTLHLLLLSICLNATSGTATFTDDFRRAQTLSTTPGANGWTIKDTSAMGTPTYTVGSTGCVLTLAADNEAEVVTLYHNDVLTFPINSPGIVNAEFIVSVSGIDSTTTLVFGMASAQNDTADSVAHHAWFRMQGSTSLTNLLTETDDATADDDDNATGATLSTTLKKHVISFRSLGSVRFSVENARVSSANTFTMEAIPGGSMLQPFVQIQKASGTGTPSVTIRRVTITYTYSYGS